MRRPNQDELNTIIERNKKRGMPGVHGLPRLLPLGVAPVPDGDVGGVLESQGQAGHRSESCV